jgi:hypothetical protein
MNILLVCGDGGWEDPPGAAGGGCGEAGLRVHGATGDEHRTDCPRKVWTNINALLKRLST